MAETTDAAESNKPTFQRHILIADDNNDARLSLKKLLECSILVIVNTVADGEEALEALKRVPCSILFTDLHNPK